MKLAPRNRKPGLTVALLMSCCFHPVVCAQAPGTGADAASAQGQAVSLSPEEEKAADMRLPEIDRSGLLPELRKPVEVEASERSPFGTAVRTFESMTGPAEATVADQLARLLRRQLRVSGITESARGRRVLIGPLAVGEGDQLPPMFANQVERLAVKEVTDRSVTFAFVEKGDEETRLQDITVSFDLRPRVDSLLIGEAFRKLVPVDEDGVVALPPLQSPGAQAVLRGAEDQELRGLVDRPTELLNAPATTSSDEAQAP